MSQPAWLFIDTAAVFGGHEVMLLRWLEELRTQARINPVLLTRAQTRLHQQAQGRVALHALPETVAWLPRGGKLATAARALIDAWRAITVVMKIKPQLCVVAEGTLLAQAGYTLLLRLLQIPTLVYVPLVEPAANMGFGRGAQRDWLVRHLYRHLPNAWITLTAGQARQFVAWANITTPVLVLPNTVSVAIEQAGCRLNTVQQPLRVLVLGRLDAHQKGLDGLLDALERVPELHTQLHISLVGDGPYAAQIKHRLNTAPLLAQWLSVQSWQPTLEVMRQHDVLLLPSRYEGVPLVMLEAMALGLPVVASDLPGTSAMLPAECLFAVGDYAQAIKLLLRIAQADCYASVVQRNYDLFIRHACGAAFADAVGGLTTELLRFSSQRTPHPASPHPASMAKP